MKERTALLSEGGSECKESGEGGLKVKFEAVARQWDTFKSNRNRRGAEFSSDRKGKGCSRLSCELVGGKSSQVWEDLDVGTVDNSEWKGQEDRA